MVLKRLCTWDRQAKFFPFWGGKGIKTMAFSPDKKYLLTGGFLKSPRLLSFHFEPDKFINGINHDDHSGEFVQLFEGHTQNTLAIAWSPDSKFVLTVSKDSTARLWNLQGESILVLQGHKEEVTCVEFSPDGQFLLTVSRDEAIKLWDLNGTEIRTISAGFWVTSLTFTPAGSHILAGGLTGNIRLWEAQGQEVQISSYEGYLVSVVCSQFHKDEDCSEEHEPYILIADQYSNKGSSLVDIRGNLLQSFPHEAISIHSSSFSPDGSWILTAKSQSDV